jgi:muramidase (phage lysozyme)
MSARKTVFPTAVQYQREKFDPSLQLQRLPDTSKQAAQPFVEEAAAIKTQSLIDENYFELQNQLDKQELLYGGQDETFLQKLAPFSPLIKKGFDELDKRVDERRKKAVDQVQGQLEQMAINGQDLSQITKQVNGLMQRADKSGQIGLLHNLSKLDWGQQAQVADGLVKNTVKNYKTSLETFQRDFGPISNDAEAQALVLAHDNRYRDMFEQIGAPASMYQNWRAQSEPVRQKALNGMVDKIRDLQGEEIRNTAYNSLYSNAQFLDVERRAMLSPKNGKRTFGRASTHTDMLKFLEKAIKAGDFNQKNIDTWKDEIHPVTKKRIGDDADYQYLFGQLQRFLDARKQEDAGSFDDLKEERSNALMGETLRRVRTGELNISDATVKELRNKAFEQGIDSPRFNKMLEYMEDGLTVEDKAKDYLETELKTRLNQGEVIDDYEMLKYGQDLFNQYQSANEVNKKNQAFQARKDLFKEGAAWLQQDSTQPEGGGGLEITTTDSVKTQGQIRLLAEWESLLKQKFDQVLATARPEDDVYKTGTINGQSVKDTALALAIQDFEKLKTNPDSVFYRNPKTGTFTNTLKIKTGTGYVGTDAANKTYAEVTSKINTIQDLAKSTNQDYKSIVTNEALLSQVISKAEAIKMKATIEKGKGIPAAILAIAALGGDGQLLTAQRMFNTYELGNIEIPARNQQLAERLADPQFLSNFPVDEFMQRFGDIHRMGPLEIERTRGGVLRDAASIDGVEDTAPGALRTNYIATQNISAEKRALLKTLQWAEGTKDKGYGTIFGGEVVPEIAQGLLTVQEMINMADTNRLPNHLGGRRINFGSGSKAAAGYQFMPDTLEDLIRKGVLRPNQQFTPQVQDMAALALTGLSEKELNSRLNNTQWNKLAPVWASIPLSTTGLSYYAGDGLNSAKELNKFKTYYEEALRQERLKESMRGVI